MKTLLAPLALLLAATPALAAPAAAGGVNGVAIVNLDAAIAGCNAFKNAATARQTTYKPQIDQAQARAQQIQAQLRAANSPAAQQARKTARRLYVGNLPIGMVGITEVLTEFLNQAMLAANLALTHINGVPLTGNPVLSVWLSAQQTFGFVEFRSEEETSAGMALNNIMFNGSTSIFGNF